jgi:uncharacterized membrane protein
MRLILSAFATLALLSACSAAEEAPPAPDAGPAPMMLGELDLNQPFHALGTEPFWGIQVTRENIIYEGVDRAQQRTRNPGAVVQGTTATYTATTDQGNALEITLTATDCSDGMSDRVYPVTARVRLGEETLLGCAASVMAMSEHEGQDTGRIVETKPAQP